MQVRNLLICTEPQNEIEKNLKRMYLKRVQEMFKRAINLTSTFNIFDEIFHGLARLANTNESMYSFYESMLTITSYYQHSQAGRGSLITQLLKELGDSEKMEFEFSLMKLPQFLGQENIKLEENELTKLKFDIVNKNADNIIFCELKMKVYSGCTAGRIELMEKFNKFTKLIIGSQTFRDCIKNSGINNIFLIGGVLFDIQGEPATTQKDEEWAICYNGMIRGKNDIIKTLEDNKIKCKVSEEKKAERAFLIEFMVDNVRVHITAVYGNEVINSLFVGKQNYGIEHFKNQLEKMLYDDLWLGQVITMSERAILYQNFNKNKKLNNYVISILKDNEMLLEVEKFKLNMESKALEKVVNRIIEKIEKCDRNLLDIKPILAETIMKLSGIDYDIRDYVADIVQFLSCKELLDALKESLKSE
ncbi:MAG: hypothetical protein ABIL49_07090 [candidate division WOR-3 bacterium]